MDHDPGCFFTNLTSAVLLGKVGESPDVTQPDSEPDHRQNVLRLVVPCLPTTFLRPSGTWADVVTHITFVLVNVFP